MQFSLGDSKLQKKYGFFNTGHHYHQTNYLFNAEYISVYFAHFIVFIHEAFTPFSPPDPTKSGAIFKPFNYTFKAFVEY